MTHHEKTTPLMFDECMGNGSMCALYDRDKRRRWDEQSILCVFVWKMCVGKRILRMVRETSHVDLVSKNMCAGQSATLWRHDTTN